MIPIDFSGRGALVTGAGAGIGREIARWFGRAGATVAVLDVRSEKAEETVSMLEAPGFALVGDARDEGCFEALIHEAAARLGGLDIAVNNIGMMWSLGSAPWLELSLAQLRDVIEQNLVLTGHACLVEARIMAEQGRGGVILNVSSGETTRPAPYMAGYGAAKTGINHLTQTLAVELGPLGIRVVAMAPGTTLTENVRAAMTDDDYRARVEATPLRRETEPEELGRLAVFLASDLARCITGQLILADAGAHLSRTRPPNIRPPGGTA